MKAGLVIFFSYVVYLNAKRDGLVYRKKKKNQTTTQLFNSLFVTF